LNVRVDDDRSIAVPLAWDERKRLFEELIRTHAPAEVRPLFENALAAHDRGAFSSEPLDASSRISCVMVTKNSFELAARSIRDFARQTHAARELVILHDAASPRVEMGELVAELGLDARFVPARPRAKIGALRNDAHAAATGAVLCQWDDDDRHHPERLSIQLRHLLDHDAQACFLQEAFHLIGRDLYRADWAGAPLRCHPGTMMVRSRAAPAYVGWAAFSEDAYFFCALRGSVVLVRGMPELYLYTHHGSNSWGEAHHRKLADELSPPAALLARERAAIDGLVSTFGLSGPLRVVGSDGAAFERA
jgi:hypothetical protein